MPFDKETAKQAGSLSTRKGTPNKTTKEVRENLQSLLESNIEKMQSDITALEPRDRLKVLLELAKFVIPTLKATELSTKEDFKKMEVNIIRSVHGKILINDFNELIQFLSLPEVSKAEVCKIIADNYQVYADPVKDKDEIIKGFVQLWNNYRLKGLEMPIFI